MQGRYGVDELYKFLFTLYIVLVIVNLFLNFYSLTIIELLLVIIIFYRVLSKNKYKRSKENQKYLQIRNNLKNKINNLKRIYKERKTKIYKKCPKCKTILKLSLPSKRGIKHVTCPKCHKRITMLCLRCEKVEVIVKKKKKTNQTY
jgi:Zn ribbon nucleic-acid-binding protein